MFCNRSKSGQPNSSDELVPQAPSTTYELIWACWKRTQRAATVVIVANSTPLLCLSHYCPSRQSFDGGDLGELQLLVSMLINRHGTHSAFFKIFLSYCCILDGYVSKYTETSSKQTLWMPPTTYPAGALAASVCHPPSPSASAQWELPWGSKWGVDNRKYTEVGIQTSTLFCPASLPLHCQIHA